MFPCCSLIPDGSMRGRPICFGSANTEHIIKDNVMTVGEYDEGESLLRGHQEKKNDTGRD